jgi:hypothetical protein
VDCDVKIAGRSSYKPCADRATFISAQASRCGSPRRLLAANQAGKVLVGIVYQKGRDRQRGLQLLIGMSLKTADGSPFLQLSERERAGGQLVSNSQGLGQAAATLFNSGAALCIGKVIKITVRAKIW